MDLDDQVKDETLNDENNSLNEQSSETDKITPERAYELAKGLQKGYTLTRQEMAELRESVKNIQEAVTNNNSDDIFDDEDKPLTKKELMSVLAEAEQKKSVEQAQKEAAIDNTIDDLRVQGIVSTEKDAESFMEYTLKAAKSAGLKEISPEYMYSIAPAWKQAEELKLQIKKEVKSEASSKIGNSDKASVGDGKPSYKQVHSKDWDEL